MKNGILSDNKIEEDTEGALTAEKSSLEDARRLYDYIHARSTVADSIAHGNCGLSPEQYKEAKRFLIINGILKPCYHNGRTFLTVSTVPDESFEVR